MRDGNAPITRLLHNIVLVLVPVLCVRVTAKTAAISFESKAKAFQEQRDNDGRE